MLYAACAVSVPPGKVNAALDALATTATARDVGTLRGCWTSEIGELNRVLMIHEHADETTLRATRDATLRGDMLGVADIATDIDFRSYALFPGVQFAAPGRVGPYFEVRNYRLKPGGLAATFAAWAKVLESRVALSPLATVMYALDGSVPGFMHIWPYASLDARMSIRESAVSKGVWPPPGGLPHIATMRSEIYVSAKFSPLQ